MIINVGNDKNLLKELYDSWAMTWEGLNSDDFELALSECGKPGADGYVISGKDFNEMCGLTGSNAYPDNLNIFAIKDFKPGILALNYGARWMFDIIENNANREGHHPFDEAFSSDLDEEFLKKEAGDPKVNTAAFNHATNIGASSPSTGLGEDFKDYEDIISRPTISVERVADDLVEYLSEHKDILDDCIKWLINNRSWTQEEADSLFINEEALMEKLKEGLVKTEFVKLDTYLKGASELKLQNKDLSDIEKYIQDPPFKAPQPLSFRAKWIPITLGEKEVIVVYLPVFAHNTLKIYLIYVYDKAERYNESQIPPFELTEKEEKKIWDLRDKLAAESEYDQAQVEAYKMLKENPKLFGVVYAVNFNGVRGKEILPKPEGFESQEDIQAFADSFKRSEKAQTRVVLDVFYKTQLEKIKRALEDRGLLEKEGEPVLTEDLKVFTRNLDGFIPSEKARPFWDEIVEAGKIDTLWIALEALYPEGIEDIALDDLLKNESDWIRNLIGLDEEEFLDTEDTYFDDVSLDNLDPEENPELEDEEVLETEDEIEPVDYEEPEEKTKVEETDETEVKKESLSDEDKQCEKLAEGFVESNFKPAGDLSGDFQNKTEAMNAGTAKALTNAEDDTEVVAVDDNEVNTLLGTPTAD